MNEHGFYLLTSSFINLITQCGGTYSDSKERPIYCCMQDRYVSGLYWAIPTSDAGHRTREQIEKIQRYCALPTHDIRSAYFYLGNTNRPAIFKISSALPITMKYIAREYVSQGSHLVMEDCRQIERIQSKLHQILAYEGRFPNRLEQHISSLREYLTLELTREQEPFQRISVHDRLAAAKEKLAAKDSSDTPKNIITKLNQER